MHLVACTTVVSSHHHFLFDWYSHSYTYIILIDQLCLAYNCASWTTEAL